MKAQMGEDGKGVEDVNFLGLCSVFLKQGK